MPTYSDCSELISVSSTPSASRCRRATFSSSSLGSTYTWPRSYLPDWRSFQSSSCASVWFVNELLITKEGWPVAQPRLSRRPSASTMTPWPSGKTKRSTWGLMLVRSVAAMSSAISISLSKWPMLPTMALFFMACMCSRRMMPLLPVVVMNTSASATMVSRRTTRKPSMAAWSAQMGSISVTYTTAPAALRAWALPLPTSP
mmetsp:Transcript_20452/g.69487  ORF Transcript_20452/g.69487 Transcript_20452/m.69487 type:complete len:201 (+) Transcript_20452:364-966(+)